MTDTELRTTTRDLYEAAEELRDDADELREQRQELAAKVGQEYDSVGDAPQEASNRWQELTEQLKNVLGTAETYEEYADMWGDGDACAFVLEELNGDEYAATIDAVSAEAARQARAADDLPQGHGMVKALEYGVVDKPEAAPADPGRWPAPVVTELFQSLNEITAPSGVDLGNESLRQAVEGQPSVDETLLDPTDSPAARNTGQAEE